MKASYRVKRMRKICEKSSVCVYVYFFHSLRRNSFIDVIARLHSICNNIHTVEWVHNSAPSASMAQICNDGSGGDVDDIGVNNSQGIYSLSMYDNQGSDLYNNIILYHISLCRRSSTFNSGSNDDSIIIIIYYRCAYAYNSKQFLCAHSLTHIVGRAISKYLYLVAEERKYLSTFIHLLMWFMLII